MANNTKNKGSFLKVHWTLWVGFICALMVLVGVSDWEAIRAYVAGPTAPSSSHDYLRLPIPGKEGVYQTMLATWSPDTSTVSYTINGEKGDGIEVGLVRIGNRFSSPCEYVFKVYEVTESGRRELLKVSRGFPINDSLLLRSTTKLEGRGDGAAEIQYVLKPKGLKERIASMLARLRGRRYFKDFAFLVPNVVGERKRDDLNVILISFDTLRADHLGCYGYDRDTSPNIDDFARRGVMFTEAISQAPWTIPAHRSLFTSLNPTAQMHAQGKAGNYNYKDILKPFYFRQTLASVLRESGHYTVAFTGGGTLSSTFGFAGGFNVYREYCSYKNTDDATKSWTHENDTEKTFDDATRWLRENSNTKFFMFLHTFECHIPYEGAFFLSDTVMEDLIEHRKALYDGDIRVADSYFGTLMRTIDQLGLMSNTIIIFLSDHGDDLYDHYRETDVVPPIPADQVDPHFNKVDHSHSLYDELIRVPLILYVPDLQPAERIVKNQVRLIDIMPTVLDILDTEHNDPIQGQSFLNLVQTGAREDDPPALSESTSFGPERKSIRKDGYKYVWIEKPDEPKFSELTLRNLSQYELFDLNSDPGEKNNIYSQNKALAEGYHDILQKTLEESRAINRELREKRKPGEVDSNHMPEDVTNALKALGYLQ